VSTTVLTAAERAKHTRAQALAATARTARGGAAKKARKQAAAAAKDAAKASRKLAEQVARDARYDAQHGVLGALRLAARDEAKLYARQMSLRAQMVSDWAKEADGTAVLELAGTVRVGQGRASRELDDAVRLVTTWRESWLLLGDGAMFKPMAELLLSTTRNCADAVQAEVQHRILPLVQGGNVADARRLLGEVVLEVEADLDPELTRERLDRAARNRRVWIQPGEDGMARVGADLEVLAGRRWSLDFTELVRAQKLADARNGVVRTSDQRRADVFATLPGRLIAFLRALHTGNLTELRDLSALTPDELADLQAFAAATADHHADADADADASTDCSVEQADDEPSRELVPYAGVDPIGKPTSAEIVPTPAADIVPRPAASPVPAPRGGYWFDANGHREPPKPIPPQPPMPPEPDWLAIAIACLQLTPDAPPLLQVLVPMSTILDLDNRSGHVEGVGPVPAQRIRELVPTAALQRLYVDETSGIPLGIDPTIHPPAPEKSKKPTRAERARPETAPRAAEHDQRPQQHPPEHQPEHRRLLALLTPARTTDTAEPQHDPSTTLARLVDLRDQCCSGPGCTLPASRCHRDHETAHPLGPTAEWNLNNKTARCHRLKHHGFTVHRNPATGLVRWTSPNGTIYDKPSPWRAPSPLPNRITLPSYEIAEPQDEYDEQRSLWPDIWRPKRTRKAKTAKKPQAEAELPAQDDEPPF
jgi:hypothetical protein